MPHSVLGFVDIVSQSFSDPVDNSGIKYGGMLG